MAVGRGFVAIVLHHNFMNDIKDARKLYAGTSGLVLAERNKTAYPPEFQNKSRLEYYASQFNSIEINSSFYKMPQRRTFEKWASMVPDRFRFTVKLWKGITHEKQYTISDLEKFFHAIDGIGAKKGCLLVQFAATSPLTESDFEKLMKNISRFNNDTWQPAIEFRHPKWYCDSVFQILDEYKASLVLHDMPKSTPIILNTSAPFIYYRFHGEKGDFRGSYTDDFLSDKSVSIQKWLNRGKDVYAYFNNTIGNAVGDLKTLRQLSNTKRNNNRCDRNGWAGQSD